MSTASASGVIGRRARCGDRAGQIVRERSQVSEPNHLLRTARERTRRRSRPTRACPAPSWPRQVNTWLHEHTQRAGALDDHVIARYERGKVHGLGNDYQAAFRAVLKVTND